MSGAHSGEGFPALNRLAENLGRWLIAKRVVLLLVFAALTVLLGYFATQIRFDAGFDKSVPSGHEYMKVYRQYAPIFGGANSITVVLKRRSGDIFDPEFMRALERLTRTVYSIPGVDQGSINSLFAPTAIFVTVNEVGYTGGRIVPATFKPRTADIAAVRQNLLKSGEIGRLVSTDLQSALVRFELVEVNPVTHKRVDYLEIGKRLEALRADFQNEDLEIQIIGFAKFITDVIDGARAVFLFFGIAFVVTGVMLYFFCGSGVITAIALLVALDAVVWQLGAIRLAGYGIDPLSILVPFLIFSIGVSHAVQMTNAWRIAVVSGGTPAAAALEAFRRLFIPGTTALLANAVGFAVIMLIDIPIIRELGISASIGVAVMIITNKFLLPAMLSFLRMSPAQLDKSRRRAKRWENSTLWNHVSACADRRRATPILLVGLIILGLGVAARQHLIVGDAGAGAPELRPEARYNLDIDAIVSNFKVGIDELTVIAELAGDCNNFDSMYALDRFAVELENLPGVKSVDSLARQVRERNVGNSEGNPRFNEIPRDPSGIGAAMRNMELNQKYFNRECNAVPVRVFTADHKADTLTSIIDVTERFTSENSAIPVKLRLAAGNGGVMAATNQAVEVARDQMLLTLYVAVIALCFLTFLSWRITACIVIPLILVSQFAEAVMAWLGIGLKVSTLPVVALGAGVGVDYGIYLFARTQAALSDGLGLKEAFLRGMQQAGTAVVFTALTMTVGVATWVFSPLKLQADMGLLLAYMFFLNMLGAILVLPALASWLIRVSQPRAS
jgi:predicted RND superfamily exporter protein